MSEEQPYSDQRGDVLRDFLGEMRHNLAALAEHFQRLGVERPSAPPVPRSPLPDVSEERDPLSVGQEILAIPSAGLEPAQVFSLAMDRVARLLSADRSMLFVWEEGSSCLRARAGRGFRRDDLATISIKAGDGLVGQAFQNEGIERSSSATVTVAEDPFLALFPVRDAVAVPIRAAGQAAGVLYAGRRAPRPPFSEQEVLLLLVVADRVGTALAHRQVVETSSGNLGRLRELEMFGGHAQAGADLDGMLLRACEAACRLAGVTVAALGVPAGPGGLFLAAHTGLPAEVAAAWRVDPGRGLTGEMFATHRPAVSRDLQAREGSEDDPLRSAGLRACLVVPLRLGHQTVGALYLADPEVRDFAPDQVAAAQVLASLLVLGMENQRLHRESRVTLEAMLSAQEQHIQSEKARAVGAMAGGIANEFNNLLAVVLGKTQLMLAREPDRLTREGLGAVEEAAWRAADIVRRLQGLAVTTMDDSTVSVDLSAVVGDAVVLTRPVWKDEAEARSVGIELDIDLDRVPAVNGQMGALREAVMNLILNAVDAMPRGGRLGVTTRRVDTGVELQVSDTGEGMPEDVRRRIFDPFFTTRSPRRTGLGLSVVHGVVDRHRGSVRVRSEPGGGTTVTLWLPVAHGYAMESRGPAVESPPEREPDTSAVPAILVLEDEEQIRSMLVDALAEAGYRVESATDGLTGLAHFQGGTFDVVLTDLSLPECSGLDVARSVKGLSPETPVVLITGWGHLLDPLRLRESGVDLMLVKPFRLERVTSVVADALRLRPGR
jgi:signal transduction histidine kinase